MTAVITWLSKRAAAAAETDRHNDDICAGSFRPLAWTLDAKIRRSRAMSRDSERDVTRRRKPRHTRDAPRDSAPSVTFHIRRGREATLV